MNNKYFRSTPFAIFLCGIAIILYIAGTASTINTMRTDISILQVENQVLHNDIILLQVEQDKLNSRLRHTTTIADIAVVLDKVERVELKMNGWDGLFKTLYGEK